MGYSHRNSDRHIRGDYRYFRMSYRKWNTRFTTISKEDIKVVCASRHCAHRNWAKRNS